MIEKFLKPRMRYSFNKLFEEDYINLQNADYKIEIIKVTGGKISLYEQENSTSKIKSEPVSNECLPYSIYKKATNNTQFLETDAKGSIVSFNVYFDKITI